MPIEDCSEKCWSARACEQSSKPLTCRRWQQSESSRCSSRQRLGVGGEGVGRTRTEGTVHLGQPERAGAETLVRCGGAPVPVSQGLAAAAAAAAEWIET
jgi:hypothetical protein